MDMFFTVLIRMSVSELFRVKFFTTSPTADHRTNEIAQLFQFYVLSHSIEVV